MAHVLLPAGAVIYQEDPEVHAQHIREANFHCRGPYVLSDDRVRAEFDALHAAVAASDSRTAVEHVTALSKELQIRPGDEVMSGRQVRQDAAFEDLWREWAKLIDARKFCGQSLTDIIIGFGQGGEFHEYECPKCGLPQTVTTALYYRTPDEVPPQG